MKLYTGFVYNEIKYLPAIIEYYKKQGLDFFFLDNYSSDGTYEYLMENNIPCYRIDTNGMFHIDMLQAELLKQIRKINPSWVIYGSADIFYIFDKPLNEIIDLAETQGYNQIQSSCYGALNTGEGFGLPLYKYYKRGVYWKDLIMISKFNETFTFFNDHIEIENKNIYNPGGVLVN